MQLRRKTDPAQTQERRSVSADRRAVTPNSSTNRFPSRHEQAIQYLTRYLFAILGMVFFNFSDAFAAKWLSLPQVNLIYGSYLVINGINFFLAWRKPVSSMRYRITLWLDIIMVSVSVANDPYDIPPSIVAYIVVVLGNGMRYGMRLFAEAIVGTLVGGAIAITLRYVEQDYVLTPGTIFLSLFGTLIVIYAYILMGRVERSRHRSELVSRTDPLTALLNRRGFAEAATDWLAKAEWGARRVVVMFADLDHFKSVNDQHGHAEGDRVLVKVADMLMEATRGTDLVARYGGDEFVLLLTDTDLCAAQAVAQRIQVIIESWMRSNDFGCGISIGVSEVPPGEVNLAHVLQSVDRLLYEAKDKRGRQPVRVENATADSVG